MSKAIVFLTDGFEEIEAITAIDILRRAEINVETVSITGSIEVIGSHGIKVIADALLSASMDADMMVLPGGAVLEGYMQNQMLLDILKRQNVKGKYLAAICAAPLVLGRLGLLDDKAAVCYPGLADELSAKERRGDAAVTDWNITTGRSAGAAAQFALELVRILAGQETAQRIKDAIYM